MNKKNKRVAMIGLGAMGTALAESLLENKIEIHIWNRSPNKTEVLEQKEHQLTLTLIMQLSYVT